MVVITAPTSGIGRQVVRNLLADDAAVRGELVWFLPAWVARRFPRPNIAYRPVPELPPATLAVAWLAESRSPAVASFVRTACEVAAAAAPPAALPQAVLAETGQVVPRSPVS